MTEGRRLVPDPIRVLLAGACGRMGQELTKALRKASGILLVYLFPITKEQHAKTLAELEKRKQAKAV